MKTPLNLTHLDYDDNLILKDPDFPTDEVITDVLEEFGIRGRSPIALHHLD
ncbi:MAG: hypothetical protein R3C53_24765 [Pirellulaceae bacterium]